MRTEKEVLKDFEKLGFVIYQNDDCWLQLLDKRTTPYVVIVISKKQQTYAYQLTIGNITMQEHKLLTELFTIWGWFHEIVAL